MNRQKKKRPIILISAGIAILLIGTLAGYLVTQSRFASELDQKTKEIESLQQSIAEQKKENEDLQADILDAMETITDLEEQAASAELSEEEESKDAANQIETETKNDASADSSPIKDVSTGGTDIEQAVNQESGSQSNEVTSSEAAEALKLVKKHISYANEPNVHFDIEGNVPGSSDLCIHVYEVVDDGESQHTATWGWYGVNLNNKSVYDTEGL